MPSATPGAPEPLKGSRRRQPFRKTRLAAATSLGLLSFLLNPLVIGGAVAVAALAERAVRRRRG